MTAAKEPGIRDRATESGKGSRETAAEAVRNLQCATLVATPRKGSVAGREEAEQQFILCAVCIEPLGDSEVCLAAEETFGAGQQLWREGEGSGLWAGEAPARTIAAAREFKSGQALPGRLTDHTSKVTIKTTPIDRLSMTTQLCRAGTIHDVTTATLGCDAETIPRF